MQVLALPNWIGSITTNRRSRTLDVTTTGGAGIDWANVENPTTSNLGRDHSTITSKLPLYLEQLVEKVTGAVGCQWTGNVGGTSRAPLVQCRWYRLQVRSQLALLTLMLWQLMRLPSVGLVLRCYFEIAGAVWDEARSSHVTAGTFGQGYASVQGNITGSVASVSGNWVVTLLVLSEV